jgi:hypothetical protein
MRNELTQGCAHYFSGAFEFACAHGIFDLVCHLVRQFHLQCLHTTNLIIEANEANSRFNPANTLWNDKSVEDVGVSWVDWDDDVVSRR